MNNLDRPSLDRPVAPMWEIFGSLEKYNKKVPFYVENPFTKDQIERLKKIIYINVNRKPEYRHIEGEPGQYQGQSRFDPKLIVNLSRILVEFECPKDIEETMDKIAKPLYNGDIALCHYNYIEYNSKYGNEEYVPALPPHADGDENLVTFNYQLGGNIDDWDLYIDHKKYHLKTGDAIVFSAVNQVHWRPKRNFKNGEFLEIVSFDYCPIDNYKFTGMINPIDPELFPNKRKEIVNELNTRPVMQKAWSIYNNEGSALGIPENKFGLLIE